MTSIDKEQIEKTKSSLKEQFLIPPFSILDTRQEYWQNRKRQWKSIGMKSDEGRDDKMLSHIKAQAEKVAGKAGTLSEESIFDPVLCETIYTWFCKPNSIVLDPFTGGSVRGIVASYKQLQYTGFDIRPEQIEANEKQKHLCDGNKYTPTWIVHDSSKMDEVLPKDFEADLVFSCPPYADLETYSDMEGDISNMDYPQFLEVYRQIIKTACSRLKNNRFACFVVGEVRNKKTGEFYNFVPDTIKAFEDAGLKYYNELILINPVAGKACIQGPIMKKTRKVGKVHQNVLAFVKGDIEKAHENVLVFMKGNQDDTNAELGSNFAVDNCILPDIEE